MTSKEKKEKKIYQLKSEDEKKNKNEELVNKAASIILEMIEEANNGSFRDEEEKLAQALANVGQEVTRQILKKS